MVNMVYKGYNILVRNNLNEFDFEIEHGTTALYVDGDKYEANHKVYDLWDLEYEVVEWFNKHYGGATE